MDTKEWLTSKIFPEVKSDPKNKNKGLIPRFHQTIADRYFGGTKESLSKACSTLAEEGFLSKYFVKFKTSDSDEIVDGVVVKGSHKGMKVGKDGKLATPIYFLSGDPDIPKHLIEQNNRAEAFRLGKKEFEQTDIM